MTELWAIAVVIVATMIGAGGPVFLKRASSTFSLSPLKMIRNKNLIAGVSLYGMSTILFIPALKGGDLSVLYPIVALGYVWVPILSKLVLKEKITALKWIGIIIITLGVSLIGLGS